jgi:hypothetical protein
MFAARGRAETRGACGQESSETTRFQPPKTTGRAPIQSNLQEKLEFPLWQGRNDHLSLALCGTEIAQECAN